MRIVRQTIGDCQAVLSDDLPEIARHPTRVGKLKDEEYMAECGNRLRVAREALGYDTGREFATLTGVSEDALSSWERGINRIPDYYLKRLKEQHHITSDYILFGDISGLQHSLALAPSRRAS